MGPAMSMPHTPPTQATGPIYFPHAEEQRQVMLDFEDELSIWAADFGLMMETSCDLECEWMEVGELQQAGYLSAACAWSNQNWAWMGPMLAFNLDIATVSWYADCDPMRWYSINYHNHPQDPGNSPILYRQAFFCVRNLQVPGMVVPDAQTQSVENMAVC